MTEDTHQACIPNKSAATRMFTALIRCYAFDASDAAGLLSAESRLCASSTVAGDSGLMSPYRAMLRGEKLTCETPRGVNLLPVASWRALAQPRPRRWELRLLAAGDTS